MAAAREAELVKLLSSAINACTKAEAGDKAEEDRALDALKLLGKQQITADLLAKTEAGKKVKKLTKHPREGVKAAAQAVIEAWKSCVRLESSKGAGSSKEGEAGASARPQQQQQQLQPAGSQSQDEGPSSSGAGLSSQGSLGASVKLLQHPPRCGDATRDKIRDLLAEALNLAATDGVPGDPCIVAVQVEDAMFRQNGGVNQKYKTKYRSLAFNLKDANNPDLRGKVLLGQISGDTLVNMSAEELASKDRQKDNEKIREHMKSETVRGNNSTASTDMFQCGKCKQRKCTYYQLQTRSADEPMTTFVTCTNCGNRWKFC